MLKRTLIGERHIESNVRTEIRFQLKATFPSAAIGFANENLAIFILRRTEATSGTGICFLVGPLGPIDQLLWLDYYFKTRISPAPIVLISASSAPSCLRVDTTTLIYRDFSLTRQKSPSNGLGESYPRSPPGARIWKDKSTRAVATTLEMWSNQTVSPADPAPLSQVGYNKPEMVSSAGDRL